MDELVGLVVYKTGLPEEMARKATEVVIGFLKERLPDPIADRLDDVISGEGLMGDVGGLLEGLLGQD
jgi:hypothetical protein